MIKLICTNCKTVWYTANTVSWGSCDACDGELKLIDDNNFENTIDIAEKETAATSE